METEPVKNTRIFVGGYQSLFFKRQNGPSLRALALGDRSHDRLYPDLEDTDTTSLCVGGQRGLPDGLGCPTRNVCPTRRLFLLCGPAPVYVYHATDPRMGPLCTSFGRCL